MSTTLSQRLRELNGRMSACIGFFDSDQKLFNDAIAQAEAMEAQAGELSDEEVGRAAMDSIPADSHVGLAPDQDGAIDMARAFFERGLRYARDHGYLKPSQAIGEQTPVASAPVCMGCFSQEAVCRQPGLCVSGRPKWIPSEVSPEARDRAGKCVHCGRLRSLPDEPNP